MTNCPKYFKILETRNPYKLKLILVILTIVLLILALLNNFFTEESVNLLSFAIIHFLGYLFFLLLPVEGLFFFYLSQGHNFVLLILIALITALAAQTADYVLGALASENIRVLIKPDRYDRYKKYLCRYGPIIIFLFNLSIFSSPIVVLVSGILRINYFKVFLYSLLGLFFKYSIITIVYYMLVV